MAVALNRFRAVVFDLDGTLIDAREWHYRALNDALEFFGESIARSEHEAEFDGLPTAVKLEKLNNAGRLERHLNPVVAEIKNDRTLREIAANLFPSIDHLLLFEWLRRLGLRIAVATNSRRQPADVMLKSAGLWEYIELVLTNEDVVNSKPDPEIYQKVLKGMKLDSSDVLVVEDNSYGVRAAEAAGCEVLQIERPSDLTIANFRKWKVL